MKRKFALLALISLVTVLVIALLPSSVQATPQPPCCFYGTVTVGGEPAVDGLTVSAKIGDVQYAITTTSGDNYGYDPWFKVPADDPDTPEKEGGVDGDILKFYVSGVKAEQEATFESGTRTRLDLSVEFVAPPSRPALYRPADSAALSDSTPTFEWTVGTDAENHRLLVDNNSDFSSSEENVLLGAKDNTHTIAGNGVPDDNYFWKVIAINPVGENESEKRMLLIDTTNPTVAIDPVTTPTNEATQTITGTFDDAFIDTIAVNGESATIDEDAGTYSAADVPLEEGTNTVTVTATDLAGNEGTAEATIVLDTAKPTISDVQASGATTSSVEITWTTDEPSTTQVEYGLSTDYGIETSLDPTLVTSHSARLTGLSAGTTFHYRAKSMDNASNSSVSSDYIFMTENAVPSAASVITENATNITTHSAVLNASIDYGDYSSVDITFLYREIGAGWENTGLEAITTSSYSKEVVGLDSNSNYEFYAYIKFDENESTGATRQFTTAKVEPTVSTESPTDITPSSATLNMSYDFKDYGSGDVRFSWREAGGSWNSTSWMSKSGSGSYSEEISGLSSGTNYDFYAQVKYDTLTKDGSTLTFTTSTPANQSPTADADGPYSVDEESSVTLDGTGSSDPDGDSLTYSWEITSDPTGEASLTGADTANPTFNAPSVDSDTEITVELTVSDGHGHSDTATATVTVNNVPEEGFPWGITAAIIVIIIVVIAAVWYWQAQKKGSEGSSGI